tara:strand:+ start:99 stop:788 length:690 start_codon:yes stop_codon:yes gene_type:complete
LTTDIEQIRDRIRRLRAMTVENGCTEAEAAVAAEKALDLMLRHGLSETVTSLDEASIVKHGKRLTPRDRLWRWVSMSTNTAVFFQPESDRTMTVRYIGKAPGPDIAVYLTEVLNRAVEDGLKTFREGRIYQSKRNPQAKRQATAEFTEAMVERLSRMLWKRMKQAHDEETYALACNALEERVPDARTVQHRNQRLRHWDARAAGHAAAGVVRLMDAVKTGFFRKQIGKG